MNRIFRNLILIVTLSSFIFQIACAQANQEQSYNRSLKTPTSTPVEETAYRLRETIDLGDRKIIVYGFQPYEESKMKDSYNTSQGQALEVLIENTGDSPFFFDPIHFYVQDSEGNVFTYYSVKSGGKSPRIESKQIAPGQKVRGYITYVNSYNPSVVYYKSLDGKMAKIAVQ